MGAVLSTIAFSLSVFGSFHCSFATSDTYLLGLYGYGIRGDKCVVFENDDDLYDIDKFWFVARIGGILAIFFGIIAMNFVWYTILYNYGRTFVTLLFMLSSFSECFVFLFFQSSICQEHFFTCNYGPGSYCCGCAIILWVSTAFVIYCGRDSAILTNNAYLAEAF